MARFSIEKFWDHSGVITDSNTGRAFVLADYDEAIELRDLLLKEFPIMRPCKCQVSPYHVLNRPTPTEIVDHMRDCNLRERRERIATEVMARRASRSYAETVQTTFGDDARFALKAADALIAALDAEEVLP